MAERGRLARRLIVAALVLTVSLCGLAGLGLVALNEPLPTGTDPERADALAREVGQAVDLAAWEKTGAVSWSFGGRNQHLWDRTRHLARVEWGDKRVLLDLTRRDGRAYISGERVDGDAATTMFEDAFSRWANDSFWLNPLAKLFDDGTTRTIVTLDGEEALMISYSSGGVTPGDSYVWLLGPENRPYAWKMWVSIIPVGGVQTSWEDWQQLPTGAWVAPMHRFDLGNSLALTDIRAAETLDALTGGEDPFAPLFEE